MAVYIQEGPDKKDKILITEEFNNSHISSESTNGNSNAEYIFFHS